MKGIICVDIFNVRVLLLDNVKEKVEYVIIIDLICNDLS